MVLDTIWRYEFDMLSIWGYDFDMGFVMFLIRFWYDFDTVLVWFWSGFDMVPVLWFIQLWLALYTVFHPFFSFSSKVVHLPVAILDIKPAKLDIPGGCASALSEILGRNSSCDILLLNAASISCGSPSLSYSGEGRPPIFWHDRVVGLFHGNLDASFNCNALTEMKAASRLLCWASQPCFGNLIGGSCR